MCHAALRFWRKSRNLIVHQTEYFKLNPNSDSLSALKIIPVILTYMDENLIKPNTERIKKKKLEMQW